MRSLSEEFEIRNPNLSDFENEYFSIEKLVKSSCRNPEEENLNLDKTGQPCHHSRINKKNSWILVRNCIVSVWQTLEAKMLSSMSYTPPEVFAYNLNSKLNSLRSPSSQSVLFGEFFMRNFPLIL